MKRLFPFPILLFALGLLAGCASYDADVERGPGLAATQRFFVLVNPNDTHGVNHLITTALTSRGLQAETGPVTMLPDDTQAIVSYQDHWAWDFGDHLIYLQIAVRDRKTTKTSATVTFSAKVPSRKSAARIADDLVAKFIPGKP